MNKRGFSLITVTFWSISFIILWALVFAPMLSTWGHAVVTAGNMTGIEAFGFDNLNLIVGVVFFIFIIAFSSLGGGNN